MCIYMSVPANCKLDSLTAESTAQAANSVRQAVKDSTGMTDADINMLLQKSSNFMKGSTTTGANRMFGDLHACKSVKTNRTVGIVQVVVGVAALVSMAMLIARGGSSRTLSSTVWYLGVAGLALTGFQLRHVISLLVKIGWHAFGTSTRANMILSTLSIATTIAFLTFRQSSPTIVMTLLVIMASINAINVYFMMRSVLKPEAVYVVALASALDRVLTARRIAGIRKFVTDKSPPQKQA